MNVESVLLSKNRDAFNRVINIMRSLIVKNEAEAEAAESVDTADAYDRYSYAVEGTDSVLDYNLSITDLLEAGFTESSAKEYMVYPKKLQTLLMYNNDNAKALISKKRKERIDAYVENNVYYRPFCGLPQDESQYIPITNSDKVSDSDPDIIYLHEVNYVSYPKTYNRLFYERDIDKVYEDFDYLYLTFLESPMKPYEIRNKKQFDICYYDKNALNANEYDYFFEAYNMARNEIMSLDYISAFEKTYSAYSNTMFMFILYYTFNLYCAKSMERYSVRDYTDDEIYDILDSNGLSKLKTLDMGLLKRVVKNLPNIKANIGTNKIIDIIFDIVADNTLTVKRYYLQKKYNIDSLGNTVVSKDNGLYSNQVDLIFQEKTIKQGDNATFTQDGQYEYMDIVIQDDTWGATHDITIDQKEKIKTEMKKQLLEADFSSIMTKYIGISKIIDMYVKTIDANDKLGILYQLNDLRGNFLKDDMILYNGTEVHALSIYAAWCLMYGTLNGLTDPDYIIKNVSTIEGIMKLRRNSDIPNEVDRMRDMVIDLGNGYNKTLGDYLSDKEISEYLVGFNFDATTPIEDIVSQYDENYEIIERIKNNLNKQSNYDEYVVWETILKANNTSANINALFGGFNTYSSYIRTYDPEFYKYIESISSGVERDTLVTVVKTLKDSFSGYIREKSNSTIDMIIDEEDAAGEQSLEDIGILLNQFMSCYDQLLSQEFHVGYDDPDENSLVLLYASFRDIFILSSSEFLELKDSIILDKIKTFVDEDYLELIHKITDNISDEKYEDLSLDYEFISDFMKEIFREYIEIYYIKQRDIIKSKPSCKLVLEHEIVKIEEL